MTNLDLLILEDNDTDFDSIHKTNFEAFNRINKDVNFVFEDNRARSVKDALDLLVSDKNFYAAIIDLKVTNEKADDAKGNELIAQIYEKYRIPIFVYSNNLPLLDEMYLGSQSQLLKAYSKADKPFPEILKEIEDLYSIGIIDILGKRGLIDTFLNKIFWDHFATNIGSWNSIEGTKEKKEKILVRHISEHLKEHLELGEGTDPFEHYVPEEVYIFPQIKPIIFSGSILVDAEGHSYLVLNPSCDFAQKKTDFILLSEVDSKKSLLKSIVRKFKESQGLSNEDPDKKDAFLKMNKLLSNSFSPRYHYLPKVNGFNGGVVDFQKLIATKKKEIKANYKVIGSVTSPFMKDITARFSYYYSRQGSPDFELEKLSNILIQD